MLVKWDLLRVHDALMCLACTEDDNIFISLFTEGNVDATWMKDGRGTNSGNLNAKNCS